MKTLHLISLCLLVALSTQAQEIASLEQSETYSLYRQANESLNVGDTKSAIEIYEQVISHYEHAGLERELPETYLGMALSFALNGNHRESIRYHKKALRAHHKYKGNESALEIELNLGLAYQLAGKERKARKYLKSEFPG